MDVNYRGDISLSITVGKFTTLPEGKELAPPGKEIGLQSNGLDVSLALHGGTLSDDARTVLRHVHPQEYQLDEQSFALTGATVRAGGILGGQRGVRDADGIQCAVARCDTASVKGQRYADTARKGGQHGAQCTGGGPDGNWAGPLPQAHR